MNPRGDQNAVAGRPLLLEHVGVFDRLRHPAEFGTAFTARLRWSSSDSSTQPAAKTSHCENPCPCGYYGDPQKECTCSPSTVTRYQKRLSGPILDRIDIHLEVQRVPIDKLAALDSGGEPSASIRRRVEAAHAIQHERFAKLNKPNVMLNGDMGPAEVQAFCQLSATERQLMRAAASQMSLSARAYHRVLKLARTIADLAGEPCIGVPHLAEALRYRPRANLM